MRQDLVSNLIESFLGKDDINIEEQRLLSYRIDFFPIKFIK